MSTKILGKKPKVKAVTVVHSSPTETVRLPTDGSGGQAVVVHPIVVRSKLPFKKKVHENKRRPKSSPKDETVPHNVNNNNSPVEAKKKPKRRNDGKANAKPARLKTQKSKKEGAVSPTKINAGVNEDPLGKVRNWLISSHNIDGFGSLKKSKSSPAGFDLSDAAGAKKRTARPTTTTTAGVAASPVSITATANPATAVTKTETKKGKKPKDNRVKLQVVYKPPFKFSVKLGRSKNEISSHLIRDKRPEAVKQRSALFVRADRVRANGTTNASPPTTTTNAAKTKNHEKSKSPTKTTKATADAEKGESPRGKAEYKRSISAPQPEPVYQNTLMEPTSTTRSLEKRVAEEPQYANVLVDDKNTTDGQLMNPFKIANDSGLERGRSISQSSRNIHQNAGGTKRKNSCDVSGAAAKQHSNSRGSSAKRRNSLDTGVGNKSVEMLVKRQCSDETDTKSTNLKQTDSGDLKRTNLQSSKVNSRKMNSSKPVRLKCTYDVDGANVLMPSVASTAKLPKRKTSTHGEGTLGNGRTKERRSHVRRSMSNNAVKDENEKFKRYSLQHVDLSRLPRSEEERNNVPTVATSREMVEIPFRQVELTSEIPSDLEVLLSEAENPGN